MPPQDEAAHEPVATPARIAPDALASGPKAGSNRAEHGTTPVSPALLAVPIVAPDQIRLPQVGTVPPHLPATLPDLLAVPLGGAMKPRLTTRPAIATEGGAADRPDAKPIRPGGLVTPHAVPAPQPWPVGNSFWPQSLPPPIEPATRSVHLSHAPDRAAKPEPEQALPIPLTERPAPDVAVAPPAPAPDAPRPVTHHLTIAPPDLAPAAPAHGHAALPPKVAATLTDAAKRATTKDEPIELLLDPVELGKVRFELTTTGDRVQVNLSVERPETLDLLRRNVDMLRSELSAAGFDASTLSFGEWGKGAGSSAPQTATQFGDDAPDLPPAAIPAATKRSPQDQGLDLRL